MAFMRLGRSGGARAAVGLALLFGVGGGLGCGDDESTIAAGGGGPGGGGAGGSAGSGGTVVGPSVAPWIVFTSAGADTPMGDNLLANPSFEQTSGATLDAWSAYESGYQVGAAEGRSGNALRLVRPTGDPGSYGASQTVTLSQTEPRPVYLAGWSKADGLTGEPDGAASIYVDISYVTTTDDPANGCEPGPSEPCALYGQIPSPAFETGTHDWQRSDAFAVPAYPIDAVHFYLLLRGAHEGTLWFDELELREVDAGVVPFDGQMVATVPPAEAYTAGEPVVLASDDGLELSLWTGGGALAGVVLDGAPLLRAELDYASGWFLHEADGATWLAPGGSVAITGHEAVQSASIPDWQLELQATTVAEADRFRLQLELTSTSGADRAITAYYALPLDVAGWSWGDDPRTARVVGGARELSTTTEFWYGPLGATGALSRYPFGTVFDSAAGLALGYSLDTPRYARIVQNAATGQLFVALDLGLTPDTSKFPNQASAELTLYRTSHGDAAYGFRSALQGFYDRFPAHFERRLPAEREGVWVAFADLSQMVHGSGESIDDFHIGFHELGSLSQVEFDDAHGIQSFRYVIEPASTWLKIEDAGVDPNAPAEVLAYLEQLYATGTESQQRLAEKTLSAGIYGPDGELQYEAFTDGPPWCPGSCAMFYLSADPDIAEPPYELNQATSYWNAEALQAYTDHPGLDGEYIDSYVMEATRPDYRASHFAAADEPLTFTFDAERRPVVPIIHSTIELTRWLRPQLPDGKFLMANGMLPGVPWGAQFFDFMGQETDWVEQVEGQWQIVAEPDWLSMYRRALAGVRPYGFLLNTNFANLTAAMTEQYMRACLFYAIYPSMFSENASEGNYFANEALYDRDRPLFEQYIPLVQALSAAGWQPITHAQSSSPDLIIERYGAWPDALYLTVRNLSDASLGATVTLDRTALGAEGVIVVESLVQAAADDQLDAGSSTLAVTLPAGDTEMLWLHP